MQIHIYHIDTMRIPSNLSREIMKPARKIKRQTAVKDQRLRQSGQSHISPAAIDQSPSRATLKGAAIDHRIQETRQKRAAPLARTRSDTVMTWVGGVAITRSNRQSGRAKSRQFSTR